MSLIDKRNSQPVAANQLLSITRVAVPLSMRILQSFKREQPSNLWWRGVPAKHHWISNQLLPPTPMWWWKVTFRSSQQTNSNPAPAVGGGDLIQSMALNMTELLTSCLLSTRWRVITLKDHPFQEALHQTKHRADSTNILHSRVYLDQFPCRPQ